MTDNSPQTTATQRFGQVLGWFGNGLGGLLILAGLLSSLYQGWLVHQATYFPAYKFARSETSDSYIAVGTGSKDDAWRAVQKHVGKKVDFGPYSHWKIFPTENLTSSQKIALDTARTRVLSEMRKKKIDNAWEYVTLFAIFLILPGIAIILLGRGLRYIFAGPKGSY